jgi:hypothetical protein
MYISGADKLPIPNKPCRYPKYLVLSRFLTSTMAELAVESINPPLKPINKHPVQKKINVGEKPLKNSINA